MVVFTGSIWSRMMGLVEATSPTFMTHSGINMAVGSATSIKEYVGLRPGRTSRGALRQLERVVAAREFPLARRSRDRAVELEAGRGVVIPLSDVAGT